MPCCRVNSSTCARVGDAAATTSASGTLANASICNVAPNWEPMRPTLTLDIEVFYNAGQKEPRKTRNKSLRVPSCFSCLSWLSRFPCLRGEENRSGRAIHFIPKFLLLEMLGERVDEGLQMPVHDRVKLMEGQADAMIGAAVLRKIVGADFFA